MFALALGFVLMVEGSAEPIAPAAVGSPPALEIIGPTGGSEGDIIILQAKTDATHIGWLLVTSPTDKSGNKSIIMPMEANTKCLVQSKAGQYIIVCSAGSAEGLVQKAWVINITANNGPNPPPPTPIDLNSKYGFVALTYNASVGKDPALLRRFAKSYSALAAKYKNTNKDVDTIAEDERSTNISAFSLQERTTLNDWADLKTERGKPLLQVGITGAQYAEWLEEYAKGFSLAAGDK